MARIKVVGGGLAGCEAAYQLLKRGHEVELYEMRKGNIMTPCHHTTHLSELVCSNSLKSQLVDTASGSLKAELDVLDSMLLRAARSASVPAGGALAVNREKFSQEVERELFLFDKITLIPDEYGFIDDSVPTIIATGPLTSDKLSSSISERCGNKLHFYDAAAPIIDGASIDYDKVFYASRYGKGEDTDYLNCGMDKEQYLQFHDALINAKSADLHSFDKGDFFESCMPIEVLAKRGVETIRYGMMKPKGIVNSRTDERYYAVVQLRRENTEGSAYNLVGFQTNLTFGEQKRVFSLIPGLESADYLRYGVMHRNTFLNSPLVLEDTFRYKGSENLFFAGQITGVEGYVESIMSGLLAAINCDAMIKNNEKFLPPKTTICGSLMRYIVTENKNFQPMNANFGILPDLINPPRDKKQRKEAYSLRAVNDIACYTNDYMMKQ